MTVYPANSSVKVIMEESTENQIVLQEVDLGASGVYKCEVMAEYPDFLSDSAEATMTVVVLPDEQPNIEGDVAGHYAVGDTVNLNCTAAPSIPAATLVWYINDQLAKGEYLQNYETEKLSDGLIVSRLGLKFQLSQSDFINGELKLKCTATISTLYHSSDEHSQQDPTARVVQTRPEEGSLVTPTDLPSASASDGLIKRLLALHFILIVFVHLLR
ncbi:kin of IRRE-like protein 3 [Homarus americanus]|uniref:kin of IRRE-like protein 3 n=1 Tax=Homarus americanus TaxID=6706 RepID=UPI001C48CA03|nr:kin of IRRE-like protein 3 [Homarus americanus]